MCDTHLEPSGSNVEYLVFLVAPIEGHVQDQRLQQASYGRSNSLLGAAQSAQRAESQSPQSTVLEAVSTKRCDFQNVRLCNVHFVRFLGSDCQAVHV